MTDDGLVAALSSRPSKDVLLAGDGVEVGAGDLLGGAEALSALLRAGGLWGRPRLGVVLSPGPRLAATCLAVMAVATCAPLDPRSRPDEIRHAFRRLDLDAVIVDDPDGAAASLAVEAGLGLLVTPGPSDGWLPEMVRRPASDRMADDDGPSLALVLSSSGTTAEPKLIGLTEANLLASARAVADTLALGPGDRCLNVMPLFHIHGIVGALLSSLVSGAAVECTSGFDAFALRRRLATPDVTWSTAVPTMYRAMLLRGRDDEPAPGLRFLRSSSAPLHATLWRELEDRLECPVLNSYGMTEASHQMASNPLPPAERRVGTVGRGAGAEIAIFRDGVVSSKGGVEGEVVVRGPGLMPGYLAPADANDSARVDGWFRTGDLGCLDADGYLTLIGRSKEIVNVGGETVSPFEVEAVVLDHAQVRDAVAFALPDALRGESVALAIVPVGDGPDPEEVRRFVAERLSRSKVPTRVVIVADIPLGPTGKVQRTRLPAQLGLV